MRVGLVANAYNEARFLKPFLQHIPDWVEKKIVLITNPPWFGDALEDDGSKEVAESGGAEVFVHPWKIEHDQRNFGQAYLSDCDWILTLEPDEFMSNESWENLRKFLETADKPAYAIKQRVMWGTGYESDPPEDFVPIIVTRPNVQFNEKRNVASQWAVLPDNIELLHWVWGRTSKEIWKKITHYSHAVDFDTKKWFEEVWLKADESSTNLHPTTPEAIPKLKKAVLPPEIEALDLFPHRLDDLND